MEESGSLFDSGPLLDWLPDETLFSLVSRLHALRGAQYSRQTCHLLFGDKYAGSHHDFPNHLHAFEVRTHGLLGSAEDIARQRTLLRYYRPFISADFEQQIVDKLAGDNVAHLKFSLGLITSRFRANHPLKACPRCMEEDARENGWAYWHLMHQYPGIWVCPKHKLPLQESILKSTGVQRFLWHVPSKASLRPWSDETQVNFIRFAAQIRSLADTTCALIDQDSRIELERLDEIYRQALARRGWITDTGRLRQHEIATHFLEYATSIRFLPELHALPETLDQSMTQVGRLFRPARSGTHPLRHIVLIDWLFRNAEDFFTCYQATHSTICALPSRSSSHVPDRSMQADPRYPQLIALLQEEHLSMHAAAKVVGIEIATAMVWAAQSGIPTSRRAKILKPAIRNELISCLMNGMDKLEASAQFGISVTTVTHVLRSEVGLHTAWESVRLETRRHETREAWQQLLAEHGVWGTKAIRNENPAVYIWLYRNDREWLKQNMPKAITPQRRTSVDWDARDHALSSAIQAAALQIACDRNQRTLRLWQIYQAVPDLKAKLSVLHRLPLTKCVVDRLIGRNTHQPDR